MKASRTKWFVRRIDGRTHREAEKGVIVRIPLPAIWYGRRYEAFTDEVFMGFYSFDLLFRVVCNPSPPYHVRVEIGTFKNPLFNQVIAPSLNQRSVAND